MAKAKTAKKAAKKTHNKIDFVMGFDLSSELNFIIVLVLQLLSAQSDNVKG